MMLPDRRKLGGRVVAQHARAPVVGPYQGDKDPQERGFARAVGADEAEELPFRHNKGNAFKRGHVAEFFASEDASTASAMSYRHTSTGSPRLSDPSAFGIVALIRNTSSFLLCRVWMFFGENSASLPIQVMIPGINRAGSFDTGAS